jgi:crotonobetainyl-CoA:carnitine CoA-transferase CaiB-like acyl-CoA transferase
VTRALTGLRVVDASQGIAGPMAAMMLADHGAQVLKVEPPGGERGRRLAGFAVWNRNKQSLVLDRAVEGDQDSLDRLLAHADVLVANEDDETWARARERNPGLVVLLVLPYLSTGAPWVGGLESNGLLAAASGSALRQSSWGGGPVDPVYPFLLYTQAIWAATVAVAALVERQKSGLGQVATVTGVNGMAVASSAVLVLDPAQPERATDMGPGGPNPSYTSYCCSDDEWVFLGALTVKFQLLAFEALGVGDILVDPRLGGGLTTMLLPENRSWVRARLAEAFASRPSKDWLAVLNAIGCPATAQGDRGRWLDHPQVDAIRMRVKVDDPERGPVVMPGVPVNLTGTPGSVQTAAPELGANDESWRDWTGRTFIGPCEGFPDEGRGPLQGLRVLDLGTILAGPYAGTLLAELGAEVIKIEAPEGDSFRVSGYTYIRGQQGVGVDLRSERGRGIFRRLVGTSDVVIDNYRRGVLERLGADYLTLTSIQPDIIAASVTGYGEQGPLAALPAFDPILQAMSGMMGAQGGSDAPVFSTIPVNDVTAAVLTAFGTCAALYYRARTGLGQRLWTSLAGASVFMQCGELVRFESRQVPVVGGRDFLGPSMTDRYYPVSDGWVRLQASPDPARDVPRLGFSEVDDADGVEAWRDALAALLSALSRADAIALLTRCGVPAVPGRRIGEMIAAEDVAVDEMLHLHDRPGMLRHYTVGRLARLSRTQHQGLLESPGLGEHTRRVLAQLGVGTVEFESLLKDGVVVEGGPMQLDVIVPYR